jgi:hypothetical protein
MTRTERAGLAAGTRVSVGHHYGHVQPATHVRVQLQAYGETCIGEFPIDLVHLAPGGNDAQAEDELWSLIEHIQGILEHWLEANAAQHIGLAGDVARSVLDRVSTATTIKSVYDSRPMWCTYCKADVDDDGHHHCVNCHQRTGMLGHPNGCPPETLASTTSSQPRMWRHENHADRAQPATVVKVRDRHNDIWTCTTTDVWTSPETADCGWAYILRKFGPLTEVRQDGPS